MNLVPSAHFIRDLTKLEKRNAKLKLAIQKQLVHLQKNPVHPSLRLHKLAGKNIYSVSITMSLRLVFTQLGDTIYLLRIGSHENVY